MPTTPELLELEDELLELELEEELLELDDEELLDDELDELLEEDELELPPPDELPPQADSNSARQMKITGCFIMATDFLSVRRP